jgi:hypothetical protein
MTEHDKVIYATINELLARLTGDALCPTVETQRLCLEHRKQISENDCAKCWIDHMYDEVRKREKHKREFEHYIKERDQETNGSKA